MNSQSETAYEQIKDLIFRMELLPGSHIPELGIAARLSISRTPVHDALRQLASEGLGTITQNRGAAVTCFSDREIAEIGALRLSQDILAAQLASYYGNAADFDQLVRLADACQEAAARGDVYGRIRTDVEFHLAIARASRNSRLIRQQYALYQQIHLIQISKYTDVEQSLLQIHLHHPLAQAIRAGDHKQIRALSFQHIREFFHLDSYLPKCIP